MTSESDEGSPVKSFLIAVRQGNLTDVLNFLDGGIDVNCSNPHSLTALHLAASKGYVAIVEELLQRGANIEVTTKKGNTVLHVACLAGHLEVVQILIHRGINVNAQSVHGFTALYMAAQENHCDIIDLLLRNGANQCLTTEDGFTPLAVALQQGHDGVVTLFLTQDSRNRIRLPALHIAAKQNDVKSTRLFLGYDPSMVDHTALADFTPLHFACHYGNIEVAKVLLEKGADVNAKSKCNITPLHAASIKGRLDMVSLLLDSEANCEALTDDGLTAFDCAIISGSDSVGDMLQQRGVPMPTKIKDVKSARSLYKLELSLLETLKDMNDDEESVK